MAFWEQKSGVDVVSLFTREWIEMRLLEIADTTITVSLFTREWIEMNKGTCRTSQREVSLFTREWIEIHSPRFANGSGASPSLRGSGLKLLHIPGSI